MTDLYEGARNYQFFQGYDRLVALRPGSREEASAAWVDILLTRHGLTRSVYDQMEPDQQAAYGKPIIWAHCGGEEVVSGGEIQHAFDELNSKYLGDERSIFASLAREERRKAGWKPGKDNQYRVDPEGRMGPKYVPGAKYGRFTLPGAEFSRGPWDGVLIKGVSFTK